MPPREFTLKLNDIQYIPAVTVSTVGNKLA